jgi:hypothetical protein
VIAADLKAGFDGVFRPAWRSTFLAGDKNAFWKIDMANLVSIDWSIEEFRRLISEQPLSSKSGFSTETPVDVEVPTSATTDRAPPLEDASSRETGSTSEGSRPSQILTQESDSSSDSMVAEVMALTALRAADGDEGTSPEADRVRDVALHILNPEVTHPSDLPERASNAENAVASAIATVMPDIETGNRGAVSAAPFTSNTQKAAEVPDRSVIAPSFFAEAREVELSLPHQNAVVRPDILASKVGRGRAIELRWVLRDIRGNRLKWSPAREEDLKVLIEFDLVEMKSGLPQLTAAGLDAI